MADLSVFPDVAAALVVRLGSYGSTWEKLPADLGAHLPAVRVRRTGGSGDRITDVQRIDVEVYATTYASAMSIGRQIEQTLISGPILSAGVVLDRVETEVGPHEAPYPDERMRLVAATYRASVRR